MARHQARIYGSSAIRRRLLKALIWAGVAADLVYVAVEVRPSRISLAAEPPAVVSLADFSRWTDLHERNEVNVAGRIDSREGTPVSEGEETAQLFIFFAPESGAEDTVVRAAVLIEPEDLSTFEAELAQYPDGNPVRLNGRVLDRPKLARAVEAAIRNRGVTQSNQFIYVTPWLGDRRDPLDNGPWFDIVLIGLCSLAVLYQLFRALRWYRNDRAVMATLSDEQIAMVRRSMREDRTSGNNLLLLIVAAVVIGYVVSKYV